MQHQMCDLECVYVCVRVFVGGELNALINEQ